MRKSTQVAVGGMASSLCLLLMFLTGVIPFSTYWLPGAAGIVLFIVALENGMPTAFLVYASVSLLSVFIAPDKEAAITFIVFLGYYPIIKPKLEQWGSRPLRMVVKAALFNGAVLAVFFVTSKVLRLDEIYAEMNDFGQYSGAMMLALLNFTFWMYDHTLTLLIQNYLIRLRPKYLNRL